MTHDFRQYLLFVKSCALVASVCAASAVPLLGLYIHQLRSVGECLSGPTLAELGARQPILWLSGYYECGRFLKPGIAQQVQPKLAVMGSSRVLQFRARMFQRLPAEEFYNLGGTVASFRDAGICIENLLEANCKPALMVLGVDWWWLQQPTSEEGRRKDQLRRWCGPALTARLVKAKRLATFCLDQIQLLQNAWKDGRFQEALRDPQRLDETSRRRLLGVGARQGGGYRNDGSFRYSAVIADPPPLEARRAEGFTRFAQGMYRGCGINEGALVEFEYFLNLCRRNNVEIVFLLPPLDKAVLDHFRSFPEAATFWQRLGPMMQGYCAKYGYLCRDYSDPTTVSASPEEFIDWYHGSDKLYARIVADLAAHEPTARIVGPYVECRTLRKQISEAKSPLDLYGD